MSDDELVERMLSAWETSIAHCSHEQLDGAEEDRRQMRAVLAVVRERDKAELEALRTERDEARRTMREAHEAGTTLAAELEALRADAAPHRVDCAWPNEGPPYECRHDSLCRACTLRLRAEKAEPDAERYRWLRDQLWSQHMTGRYYLPIAWAVDADKRNAGDNMDAAIDEARKGAA